MPTLNDSQLENVSGGKTLHVDGKEITAPDYGFRMDDPPICMYNCKSPLEWKDSCYGNHTFICPKCGLRYVKSDGSPDHSKWNVYDYR